MGVRQRVQEFLAQYREHPDDPTLPELARTLAAEITVADVLVSAPDMAAELATALEELTR